MKKGKVKKEGGKKMTRKTSENRNEWMYVLIKVKECE